MHGWQFDRIESYFIDMCSGQKYLTIFGQKSAIPVSVITERHGTFFCRKMR